MIALVLALALSMNEKDTEAVARVNAQIAPEIVNDIIPFKFIDITKAPQFPTLPALVFPEDLAMTETGALIRSRLALCENAGQAVSRLCQKQLDSYGRICVTNTEEQIKILSTRCERDMPTAKPECSFFSGRVIGGFAIGALMTLGISLVIDLKR